MTDSRDPAKEATVVRMTFSASTKDGASTSSGGASTVSLEDERKKRAKPVIASPQQLESKITALIQRLANLIDENRNELEVANKRIDHLTLTVRRLLGELHERGMIL